MWWLANKGKNLGFTIVELLVVIVVIGILASIVLTSYSGVQKNANIAVVKSDLNNILNIFEMYKVENGSYPNDISITNAKFSENIILQSAIASNNTFCVNAYHKKDPTLRMSWNSAVGLQDGLCNGATTGSPIGGIVPEASRNINLSPDFSRWTLSGAAAYNITTKELSISTNGVAISPIIRVDHPTTIRFGGDFYATVASVNAVITPSGGYHHGISYFMSDGVTPVANSYGNFSNGCAQKIDLNVWSLSDTRCAYGGGPQVMYIQVTFRGSGWGYASADLKIRNPLIIIYD